MPTPLSGISSTQLRRAARIKEKIEKLQRKLENVIANGTTNGSASGRRNLMAKISERHWMNVWKRFLIWKFGLNYHA